MLKFIIGLLILLTEDDNRHPIFSLYGRFTSSKVVWNGGVVVVESITSIIYYNDYLILNISLGNKKQEYIYIYMKARRTQLHYVIILRNSVYTITGVIAIVLEQRKY